MAKLADIANSAAIRALQTAPAAIRNIVTCNRNYLGLFKELTNRFNRFFDLRVFSSPALSRSLRR
jgi:hypothetical protein